jgi:tRNA(fMet)-specific endonuclease VapC
VYLLDTNIISHVAHDPGGAVGQKLARIDPDEIMTSVVVAGEVWSGVENNVSFKSRDRTKSFMETIEVLGMEPPVAKVYGAVRARMKKAGVQLGANDMLIAAHALSLEAILVTADEKAFSRVPELKIENWLRAESASR